MDRKREGDGEGEEKKRVQVRRTQREERLTWYRLMKLAISNPKVGMVPSTHD